MNSSSLYLCWKLSGIVAGKWGLFSAAHAHAGKQQRNTPTRHRSETNRMAEGGLDAFALHRSMKKAGVTGTADSRAGNPMRGTKRELEHTSMIHHGREDK